MKNFKKLFIALPLVLVMLFAALPVFAEADTYQLKAGNLGVNLKIDKNVVHNYLDQDTYQVPIWAAETTTYAENKGLVSMGAGWINLLNDGKPVGWVEANPDAAAPLVIGQYAVENLAFFKDNGYFLPIFNINHVEKVTTNIKVPASWTKGYKAATAYIAAENFGQVAVANKPYAEGDLDQDMVLDKDAKTVTYNGTTYNVKTLTEDESVTVNVEAGTADTSKVKADKAVGNVTAGTETDVTDMLYALGSEAYTGGDKATAIGEWTKTVKVTKYIFDTDVYYIAKGDDVTAKVENVTTNESTKVTTADVKGKNGSIEVTFGKAVETFVDATLQGLLVIVDEKYVPVTVKHHYMVADGEEIVKETKENQDKNVVLTPNNILQSWLMPVGSYVYDPAQTKVEKVTEDKTLINGEVFVTGYVVDLFYTAAEGEESDIEAAFANTTAGVANQQNVANLPATGAASNVAVILSSVALVVVGLFLKK